MGVDGLWELLATTATKQPSLETLSNQVVAVDTSLWLVQFIKAMRDKDGNVRKNAHLEGMLSRICKLLYYNIKPVFVFDGAAPEIKRKTIARRRRQRDLASENVQRMAEKLLLLRMKFDTLEDMKKALKKQTLVEDLRADGIGHFESEFDWDNVQEDLIEKPDASVPFVGDLDEIDEEALAALPFSEQYEIMEQGKLQMRQEWRREYIEAQSDMNEYSSLQLRNYLKASEVNQRIDKIRNSHAEDAMEKVGDGEFALKSIVSMPDTKFVLQKRQLEDIPKGIKKFKIENTGFDLSMSQIAKEWDCEDCDAVNIGVLKKCQRCGQMRNALSRDDVLREDGMKASASAATSGAKSVGVKGLSFLFSDEEEEEEQVYPEEDEIEIQVSPVEQKEEIVDTFDAEMKVEEEVIDSSDDAWSEGSVEFEQKEELKETTEPVEVKEQSLSKPTEKHIPPTETTLNAEQLTEISNSRKNFYKIAKSASPQDVYSQTPLSSETIDNLQKESLASMERIRSEQSKQRRNADHVTDTMSEQVFELLDLCGIPYIVAPAEAEAQCAFLNEKGLVQAILTNDSDVFLFGAQTVYRNVFDQSKSIEKYTSNRIASNLALDRTRLILLAMLLGSDYTEGVNGIGIVNALEVLSAFSDFEGLEEFREWVFTGPGVDSSKHESNEVKTEFKRKHDTVRRNWGVSRHFPSRRVYKAYTSPSIDKSLETFSFGSVDEEGLLQFCIEKLGLCKAQAKNRIEPILSSRPHQMRIDQFFSRSGTVAEIKSKRLEKALNDLKGKGE